MRASRQLSFQWKYLSLEIETGPNEREWNSIAKAKHKPVRTQTDLEPWASYLSTRRPWPWTPWTFRWCTCRISYRSKAPSYRGPLPVEWRQRGPRRIPGRLATNSEPRSTRRGTCSFSWSGRESRRTRRQACPTPKRQGHGVVKNKEIQFYCSCTSLDRC